MGVDGPSEPQTEMQSKDAPPSGASEGRAVPRHAESAPDQRTKPPAGFSLKPDPGWRAGIQFALFGVAAGGFIGKFAKQSHSEWLSWIVLSIWGLGFTAIAVVVARYRYVRRRTQFRLNERAEEALGCEHPIVLYLRPFVSSGRLYVESAFEDTVDRWLLGKAWDAELALTLAMEGQARLLAIGETRSSIGAAKLKVDDAHWEALMQRCAESAAAIVMVPYPRPSTLWEVRYLASRPALLAKTLFLMPPTTSGPVQWWMRLTGQAPARLWADAARKLEPDGIRLPPYDPRGAWFVLGDDGNEAAWAPLMHMSIGHTLEMVARVSKIPQDPDHRRRRLADFGSGVAREAGIDRARPSGIGMQEWESVVLSILILAGIAVFLRAYSGSWTAAFYIGAVALGIGMLRVFIQR